MASGYDDFKTFLVEIKKDKSMKRMLQVLVAVLVFLLIYAIGDYINDSHHNKHAKLFFGAFECNIPKDHPDTLWSTLTVKDDTITIYKDKIVYVDKNKTPNLGTKSVPDVSVTSTNQKDHAQTAQTIINTNSPQ